MAYRVVQWNPGAVDRGALRGIITSSAVELVGLGVGNGEHVGADAGALAGTAATGILATTNLDELLQLIPDCVHYAAPPGQDLDAAVADLVRILESGASVVTTTFRVLPSSDSSLLDTLRAAAGEGAATLYTSGTPLGVVDVRLPLVLSSAAERVDAIRLVEVYGDSPDAAALGVGASSDDLPPILRPGALTSVWAATLHTIARGLDVELGDLEEQYEGVEERGTVVAVRFEVRGMVGGAPRLVVEHVARLRRDVAPDWPMASGAEGYRVVIEGEPHMVTDVALASSGGVDGRATARAMSLINAIPAVCRARPGLLTALDVHTPTPATGMG